MHIRDGNVKARKEHKCWYCGEVIAKGEMHHTWTGTNEDCEIATIHTHPECNEAWHGLYRDKILWDDEGLDFAEYYRGSRCRRDTHCECHADSMSTGSQEA